HFDVDTMARLVLGRNAWMQATPEQRKRFTKDFTRLVIRTYASAMASYTNQTIKFMPIRGGYEGLNRIQVQSLIIREDGPSIPVNYRLELVNNEWFVYDFSVEGVSIIESFRSQFADALASEDLDNVILKLERHNAGSD